MDINKINRVYIMESIEIQKQRTLQALKEYSEVADNDNSAIKHRVLLLNLYLDEVEKLEKLIKRFT